MTKDEQDMHLEISTAADYFLKTGKDFLKLSPTEQRKLVEEFKESDEAEHS